MIELSKERIGQILHEETLKTEDVKTILRSVYNRYMHLYEKYFADIDALNDETIAEMRKYNEETQSLIKYYYMDMPMDVCRGIGEFEKTYGDNLLGPDWHKYLLGTYKDFKDKYKGKKKDEAQMKAEFAKETLSDFYEAMDYIFRDGFGTGSQTVDQVVSGIQGLLFGKSK